MKEIVRSLVYQAIERAVERNLISIADPGLTKIEISRSKEPRFGDYATNAALVLSSVTGLKPRDLAELIQDNIIADTKVLASTEIAGPGFINFFLAPEIWHQVLETIHREKNAYGCAKKTVGPKILLEFVSANPTGPLHVGHGRGAAIGDTLARLLKICGRDVQTEYYVNDAGNQMKILGGSLLIRFKQIIGEKLELPENYYKGDYMIEIAEELKGTSLGEKLLKLSEDEAVSEASRYARDRILDGIKEDLSLFGVTYDNYFSELQLYESGILENTLEILRKSGRTEKHDEALWFVMDGEDEKDRVLVRATGEPTYFAADAAYHENKFSRGFQRLVDIWGSDHHGYVPRVRAAIEALGHDSDALKVLLVQFVTLVREGQKISMSTRSGEFVTLRKVLDEVGSDAARFFFLTKRCDSHLDFDLDLAKRQSRDNPVYYVQYAHARVASIFRIAAERNIDVDMSNPDLGALSLPEEIKIMKHLGDFPDMLYEAADALEPHRITFYLMDLADMFHAYYHDNRVLMEDERLKKARLYLVEAVRTVIATGLGILGVTAPERM